MADLIAAAQIAALLPALKGPEALAAPSLIGAASRAVEKLCRRPLALATHVEYHRPGMTRVIRLAAPPVVPWTLNLRASLRQVLAIACTDPAARRATVTLTATQLVLAKGHASPATLALSGYATAGDLAAAVTAQAGWVATIGAGMDSWAVADLEPSPGALGAVGTPASIVAYTRDLAEWAMDRPDLGVVELTEDRPQEYRYPDRAYGSWGGGGFIGGTAGDPRAADVRCSYTGGYDPTGAGGPTPPEDLAMAVALTIKALLDSGQWSGNLTSVSLGNTSVAIGEQMAVPAGARALLSPYIRRSL